MLGDVMKKRIIFVVLLCIYAFYCNATTIKQEDSTYSKNEYIVYKIEDKDSTVYIAGSIHVGLPDFYPFPSFIEDAFNSSDYLVVEVDITKDENVEYTNSMISMAIIADGKTIDQVISPNLYKRLGEALAKLGIPMDNLKTFQPWFFSIFLPTIQIASLGYSEEYGVDRYFINKAKQKKKILELESVEEQIKIFRSLNNEEYLSYTLLTLDTTKTVVPQMVRAWRHGDEEALSRLLQDEYENSLIDTNDIYNKLFTKRDEKMTQKIKVYLDDDKDYFVVVGSGHVVGNKGIISRLRTEGLNPVKLK